MSDEEVITLDNGDYDEFIEESNALTEESNVVTEETAQSPEAEANDDSVDSAPVETKKEKSEEVKDDDEKDKLKEKEKEEPSENFKIEIGGLPKYYSLGHLKKLLNNTLQLDAHRVKPGGMGRNVAYVDFKNEEIRTKAKLILDGYKWSESTLTAIDADPAKDPMLLAKIDFLKVPKKEHETLPLLDRITKAVTPFHDLSYENQIKCKDKVVKQVMRKFGNELAQMNPELKDFVHWHKIRRKGQVCEMDEFIEAPVKEGYLNICEFIIGSNKESEHPIVGFRVASYKEGSVEVGGIGHLKHINEKTKEIAKSMEDFLKDSEHKPYDPFTHDGVWRQLTVRTSNNNDLMIIIVIHPQELSEDDIQAIKDSIIDYFSVGGGSDVGVTSIFIQKNNEKDSIKEVDYEHLWGKEYIEETILGKTFRASPDAFLQPNTSACELLYTKISEVLEIDQTTVLLDVCCGVGAIGLTIAGNAYKIFGVEANNSSVDNARINCETNEVVNAVFYHGKAEDYIDNMIERSERVNTVAVVDPPKAGLNGSVMNALRKCEYMDKLVYITSDPQSALANFQALGRPRSKNYKGTYFVPIRATPIDMFPDTPNFQLVIVFERYDECKWDRIMAGNPRPKDQSYYDRVPELKYDPEQVKKDREDRRKKEREERKKSNPRSRGGGRNDRYSQERSYGDGRGPRTWGRGYGRRDAYDHYDDRPARPHRAPLMEQPQQYGVGFQEGFRAGLEALQAAAAARTPGNISGFGQGGGWNMAQTQGGYNQGGEDFNMNYGMGGRSAGGTWGQGFRGNNATNFSNNMGDGLLGGYNKGGGLLADPEDGVSGFEAWNQNQSFGGGSSGWSTGGNSQGSWNQQDDEYPPPLLKKFRNDDSSSGGGYNNYNFGNFKR